MSADARERWRRVDGIVEAALELAPSERPAFLSDACGEDVELRRDVESLLAHDRSDDFLEVPAAAEAARLTGAVGSASLAGQRIGRFAVLERPSRRLRDAEIEQLDQPVAADHDVVGLDVTMHDADRVGGG